jgi:hypothetical protein
MTSWAQALLARLRGLMARPGLAGNGPLLAIAGVLTLAAAVALGTGLAHAGANGTTISATKTATAHWDRTFRWTIGKSVTPNNWSLFNGDSGTSDYTVAVANDGGTDTYYVDGQICVTNGGGVATTGLQIVDNLILPGAHGGTIINTVNVDVSAHPSLASGGDGVLRLHDHHPEPGARHDLQGPG